MRCNGRKKNRSGWGRFKGEEKEEEDFEDARVRDFELVRKF